MRVIKEDQSIEKKDGKYYFTHIRIIEYTIAEFEEVRKKLFKFYKHLKGL